MVNTSLIISWVLEGEYFVLIRNLINILLVYVLSTFIAYANGGVWLDATRIIYNQSDNAKSIKVNNSSSEIPYLIRAWVTEVNSSESDKKWVVTPPIYRLNEESAIQLKLALLDKLSLPADRESLFYLNTLSIPGEPKDVTKMENDTLEGKITIAINSKIKIFYRPDSLLDVEMSKEYKKLEFSAKNKNITIKNPTAFHMNFLELKVDGVNYSIDRHMVAPFSTVTFSTKSEPKKLDFRLINDFGGKTALESVRFKG